MMKVFCFYTAAAGFTLGIFVSSLAKVDAPVVLWMLLLSVGLGLIWRRNSSAIAAPYIFLSSIFLVAVGVGVLRVEVAEYQLFSKQASLAALEGERVTLEGVVAKEPEVRERTLQLVVETPKGRVLVQTDRYAGLEYGDLVEVNGTVKSPSTFDTELGRTFNYPGYLKARHITHTISFADVEELESGYGNPVVSSLLRFKHALISSFSAVIPEPEAGLGAGLLLGVKQALGESLESAFRKTGIIHIVVLSGYNVMIVAEAIMRLLAVFLSVRKRLVVGVLAIVGFAVMVGLSATVVRASIMAILVLIARATGRTYLVMRALVGAGLVMLILNPFLLVFDPGFQLSFLATLGLILVAPHLETLLQFAPTKLQIREFITATVATQLFVLPLLLYLIGEFSVVAVLVNVLVLPMVPLAMLLVFVTGMVGLLSPVLAVLPGAAANLSLSYIVGVAERFGSLPFASFAVPPFPFWVVLLLYALLSYGAYRLSRKHSPDTSPNLSGWTIVEEDTLYKKDEASTDASSSPVFFR